MVILRLVLDKHRIGDRAVFRVKGYTSGAIVGRMDFVESILRRDVRGIRLSEIEVEEGRRRDREVNIQGFGNGGDITGKRL